MIYLLTIFSGISIACMSWILLHHLETHRMATRRISGLPENLGFPYHLSNESRIDSAAASPLSLDDSYGDKFTRQLFLGGVRNRKRTAFFHLCGKLSLIIPAALLIGHVLKGTATFHHLLIAGTTGMLIYASTLLLIRSMKVNRQKKILGAMPQFFDLLVVCLETGLNFSSAMPRVIEETDPSEPLVQEFALMHHELMGGFSLPQACDRLSKRCEVMDLSIILNSLIQSEQMGSSLANVLRIQARELRDKHRQRMREKAHQIPVKLLFPMVLIFVALFSMTIGPAGFRLLGYLTAIGSDSVFRG